MLPPLHAPFRAWPIADMAKVVPAECWCGGHRKIIHQTYLPRKGNQKTVSLRLRMHIVASDAHQISSHICHHQAVTYHIIHIIHIIHIPVPQAPQVPQVPQDIT